MHTPKVARLLHLSGKSASGCWSDPQCHHLQNSKPFMSLAAEERLQPGTGTYGIQFAYRLEGPGLNIQRLALALEQLTCRHTPLRTVLLEDAQRGDLGDGAGKGAVGAVLMLRSGLL